MKFCNSGWRWGWWWWRWWWQWWWCWRQGGSAWSKSRIPAVASESQQPPLFHNFLYFFRIRFFDFFISVLIFIQQPQLFLKFMYFFKTTFLYLLTMYVPVFLHISKYLIFKFDCLISLNISLFLSSASILNKFSERVYSLQVDSAACAFPNFSFLFHLDVTKIDYDCPPIFLKFIKSKEEYPLCRKKVKTLNLSFNTENCVNIKTSQTNASNWKLKAVSTSGWSVIIAFHQSDSTHGSTYRISYDIVRMLQHLSEI